MPLFDLRCQDCGERHENVIGEIGKLKCPGCGSRDVERLWNGSVIIRIPDNIQGSTPGVRAYAQELTKKLSK